MPSSLAGLFKKLEWAEFRGNPSPPELAKLNQAAASSGKTVGMAGTASSFDVKFGSKQDPVVSPVPGSSPPAFTLEDSVVVTVNFDSGRSWKRIDPLSTNGAQILLDHEQGHYDISALMARDCFIDLMQLKAKTYNTQKAGQDDAKDTVKQYKDKLQPVQDEYDDDTTHGAWVTPSSSFFPERKESFQVKWEGFFRMAFSNTRSTGETSPDGVPYKIRLLDVLANGGFRI